MLRRLALVLSGLVVGLVVVELAFRWRDHGAFPHLNVYVADRERGVRLRPGATELVQLSDNPLTHVRINADGYRGGQWPAPDKSEILIIGDSQAFGLGVEEGETFGAQLARLSQRQVGLAADLGARSVDAWTVLASVEPGAFLDHDLHMTPKGHAAVAAALARALANVTVK